MSGPYRRSTTTFQKRLEQLALSYNKKFNEDMWDIRAKTEIDMLVKASNAANRRTH